MRAIALVRSARHGMPDACRSNANGVWAIHTGVDVQRYVTLEAGCVGTALTPMPDATLQPYAFFGAAWRHYDVAGESFTADAGMSDSDDLFQVPVGVGMGYRHGGFVGDARFTYRPSVGQSLVLESDGNYATMNAWGLSAGVGYEF